MEFKLQRIISNKIVDKMKIKIVQVISGKFEREFSTSNCYKVNIC